MMRTPAARGAFLVMLVGLVAACQLPYAGGAKAVSPNQLGREWLRAAPTPVVRQRQRTDCGLAALAMVAGAWGRSWTLEDLSRQIKPTDKGVKLGALRDLARARGLEAFAVRGKAADLEHELGQGRPVLLGLLLPFDQGRNASHYEVVVAYNPRDGSVVTLDPASGSFLSRSKQVLDLEWKPAGYPTLVVIGDRAVAAVH
jgi:ABC-type bacteriocin/lantibiotic exporter with double-glycine peptidase domain